MSLFRSPRADTPVVRSEVDYWLAGIVPQMIELLMADPARRRVTKFLSPTETIKVTYRGKRGARDKYQTVVVTFGKPNYTERKFIKECVAAGEPFPVKKLQIYTPRCAR